MSKLLYIEASPRKERSASIAVARTFLEEYQRVHPSDDVVKIDLWDKELPSFDGDVIAAKYAIMHGKKHTSEQAKAWKEVEALIGEFKAGDKYLFSLPMWNFGIPYRLKHYIDILVQPGYAFKVDEKGAYEGLIKDKKVALVYARGGEYGSDAAIDMQRHYMENVLGFIGFKEFHSITVEPTMSEKKEAAVMQAKEKAKQVAAAF